MKKIKNFLTSKFFIFFAVFILALSVRGIYGNPTSAVINSGVWTDNGPFELSPERGRFALALSIIENKSFYFSKPIAQFATPDLGFIDGKYVSLFAPGVSFMTLPGFLIGARFGLGQVGMYSFVALFALFNGILIVKIAKKLGASEVTATLGSLVFLFATPAFAYGVSLYQHHISLFLILSCIWLLMNYSNLRSLALIWFLTALSIPVDYPNLFMMTPIAFFALGRYIKVEEADGSIGIKFNLKYLLAFVTAILPLTFFLWFNKVSYGNPLQLSGTVTAVQTIDDKGNPVAHQPDVDKQLTGDRKVTAETGRSAVGFFLTRNLLNGFYIHFLSPDRGVIYYTPVVLFGLLAFLFIFKKNNSLMSLLVAIVGVNILLYSLWGDPWGGWAFGSRYLIPSYAIMAIFIALVLTKFRRKTFLLVAFFAFFSYSVSVNTLGALTSSRNPPQVEVLSLEELSGKVEKYTYGRNLDYLQETGSKSYLWQAHFSQFLSASQYYLFVIVLILAFGYWLIVYLIIYEQGRKYDQV